MDHQTPVVVKNPKLTLGASAALLLKGTVSRRARKSQSDLHFLGLKEHMTIYPRSSYQGDDGFFT